MFYLKSVLKWRTHFYRNDKHTNYLENMYNRTSQEKQMSKTYFSFFFFFFFDIIVWI